MKEIDGTDLFLAYEGKMGIDMLVAPAIAFAKSLIPEKTDWVQLTANNGIKISLGDINKLEKVFQTLELKNIYFAQGKVVVEADFLP